ncbi:hypothetical protein B0H14DRAFT_3508079 [Mycena olivaceomarginata]|nr:hypothetical protein B0H14DRAFT_3508079 [Mycena olivaceomarginata]
MSLPSMDIVTGALLIGTWVSSVSSAQQVTVTFTIDTVSTFADCACVYLYTITHAGDPVYLATQHWPIALYIVTTAIVAVLVQSFLVERYWRFTKSIIITLFLGLLITAAVRTHLSPLRFLHDPLCTVWGCTHMPRGGSRFFPAFKDRGKLKIPGTIWLVNQAVADLSIAAALLWELRKVKSDFKETRRCARTVSVILWAQLTTGVSATVAAIALTTCIPPISEIHETYGTAMQLMGVAQSPSVSGSASARVYVLTMLSNLNFRHSKPAPRVTLELSGSGFTEQSDIQFHHSDLS